MIPPWVSYLFALLAEWYATRRCAQIKFLKLQLELAMKKIPATGSFCLPKTGRRCCRLERNWIITYMMSSAW
ncbi:MAG: hypothetical protein WCI73_07695 [Phycisphaerae bacterium]